MPTGIEWAERHLPREALVRKCHEMCKPIHVLGDVLRNLVLGPANVRLDAVDRLRSDFEERTAHPPRRVPVNEPRHFQETSPSVLIILSPTSQWCSGLPSPGSGIMLALMQKKRSPLYSTKSAPSCAQS